jgi:hypothetical protein
MPPKRRPGDVGDASGSVEVVKRENNNRPAQLIKIVHA